MEHEEVTKLAVDDPLDRTVAVLALNLEDLAASVARSIADAHAVADAEAEVTDEDRDCAVTIFVAVQPRLQYHDWKSTGDHLVGHCRHRAIFGRSRHRPVPLGHEPRQTERIDHAMPLFLLGNRFIVARVMVLERTASAEG
jgi:hypothetical protein